MSHNITVAGGTSVRLPTAGKYCDRDILITATGGGVDLPELTNQGQASDLMEGKELIDGEGVKVTGTFSLDEELTEQDSLILQIQQALEGKAVDGGAGNPSLYQRVEYITSAQDETYPYIVTDFVADNEAGLEIVASFPVMQDRIPMGSREDSGATRFYCAYPLSTSSIYYGFGAGASTSCSCKTNTIYRLQTNFLNSRLVCCYEEDGTRKANGSINATITQHSVPVSIFGYHSAASGAVTSKREYKLYSARCSRGHEVVREYIPCYRKRDGVVGLYEKFTGTFLTAEDGGVFAKGADIDW